MFNFIFTLFKIGWVHWTSPLTDEQLEKHRQRQNMLREIDLDLNRDCMIVDYLVEAIVNEKTK